MKHDDLGNKEMTVTVKEVAEILVAAVVAAEKAQLPEITKEAIIGVIFTIFSEYAVDIMAYIEQQAQTEKVAKFFSKGMCNN